jgi:hypothetical protein
MIILIGFACKLQFDIYVIQELAVILSGMIYYDAVPPDICYFIGFICTCNQFYTSECTDESNSIPL